jgi:hypothetical protein
MGQSISGRPITPMELKGRAMCVKFDKFAASYVDIDRELMVQLLLLCVKEKKRQATMSAPA